MSIKAENVIPIFPQPLPATANEAVFIADDTVAISDQAEKTEVVVEITDAIKVFSLTPNSDSIDIPLSKQERTLWCWAACAQMVLFSVGLQDLRQCRIAQSLIDKNCCAASCGKKCCNNDCSETDVQVVLESFGVSADLHDGTISFAKLQEEISKNRLPVEVGIDWDGDNGGHLIVISGWSRHQDARRVKVKDPLYGEGEIRFSDLAKYRGGRWVFTWTGFSH